jgi:rod shape-determining protein MreD
MARFLFGLLIVATALMQATLLPRINPFHASIDLVLVFLFLWSANRSLRESLFWVFFIGVFLDVLGLDPFGTNSLSLIVVVVLAGLVRQRVLQANVLVPMALVAIATVVHGVILALLRGESPLLLTIPIQAVAHMLLIPLIYLVLRVFNR